MTSVWLEAIGVTNGLPLNVCGQISVESIDSEHDFMLQRICQWSVTFLVPLLWLTFLASGQLLLFTNYLTIKYIIVHFAKKFTSLFPIHSWPLCCHMQGSWPHL